MRVAITGASGQLGQHCVAEFLKAGHELRLSDRVSMPGSKIPFQTANIRDLGQVLGAISGCEAVLHLAAIPAPIGHPQEEVFANNVLGTFNVLEACTLLGISRIVTISSISAMGVAYAYHHPVALRYVPLDEDHPLLPQDAYGLSKQVGEDTCAAFNRRTGGDAVSLRFPAIWDSVKFPDLLSEMAADEHHGHHTLWSY